MHIHYADGIPSSLGAWDALPPSRTLARAARQAEEHAADRSARCEQIESEIHFALAAEEKGVLHFVPNQPTAIAAVIEGLDHDDLMQQMAQLLVDVAAGHRMQGHASELLRRAVACFADDRAGV